MAKINTTNWGTLALLLVEPEAPMTEKLAFLTDLIQSHDGTEERIQLRSKPRRKIEYNFFGSFATNVKAMMTAVGAIRKLWAVPIWAEAEYVGSVPMNVNGNTATIACKTAKREYRAGKSLALLYKQCGQDFRIIEIDSISGSGISFSHGLQAITGAYIMPLRVGFVVDNIDYVGNGKNGKYKVVFSIEDTEKYTGDVEYDQYKGLDFVSEQFLTRGGEHNAKIVQDQEIHDQSLGIVSQRTSWVLPKTFRSLGTIAIGADECFDFKAFIQKMAGRSEKFWMPTFTPDIQPINVGTITNELHIYADATEYLDYASLRKNVAIRLNDGSWICRGITNNLAWTGGRVRIVLDSAINVNASEIDLVCYLTKNRLASDEFELTVNQGIMSCVVNLAEIEQ